MDDFTRLKKKQPYNPMEIGVSQSKEAITSSQIIEAYLKKEMRLL